MGIENGVILLFGLFFLLIVGQSLFRDFSLKGLTEGVMWWLALVVLFAIGTRLIKLVDKHGKGKVIVYSAFIVMSVLVVLSIGLNMGPVKSPAPTLMVTPFIGHAGGNNSIPQSPCQGATAICWDGWCSYSQHRSGTCSGHGGVKQWLRSPAN
jgi:hypothetical protein